MLEPFHWRMAWRIKVSSHWGRHHHLLYLFRDTEIWNPVVINAEDTDVVLSAFVAHNTDGILAIKRKKDTINCRDLCPEDNHCSSTYIFRLWHNIWILWLRKEDRLWQNQQITGGLQSSAAGWETAPSDKWSDWSPGTLEHTVALRRQGQQNSWGS